MGRKQKRRVSLSDRWNPVPTKYLPRLAEGERFNPLDLVEVALERDDLTEEDMKGWHRILYAIPESEEEERLKELKDMLADQTRRASISLVTS